MKKSVVIASALVVGALLLWKKDQVQALVAGGGQAQAEGGKSGAHKKKSSTGSGGERAGGGEGGDAAIDPHMRIPDPNSFEGRELAARTELMMATKDLEAFERFRKYPETARPASEVAETRSATAHWVPKTTMPLLRVTDGKVQPVTTKSTVSFSQDRYHLYPGVAIHGEIRAEMTDENQTAVTVRCKSLKAIMDLSRGVALKPSLAVDVPCVEARDGSVTYATFTFNPMTSPMAKSDGTIRLVVDASVEEAGSEVGGVAATTVNWSPTVAGKFTGKVRQAYEKGSVAYYLGFEAARTGFLRASIRVDQGPETGMIGLLEVRQRVKVGPVEVRAELFGKIAADAKATSVRLRDMDGRFIVEPGDDPAEPSGLDLPLPGIDGVFFTGKIDLAQVKSDEYQSPENDAKAKHYQAALAKAQDTCNREFDGCKDK